jgi:SAM-dependent methyltransferase
VDYLEATRAVPVRTKWSRYVQAPHAKVGDAAGYDQKQRAVDGFLSALPPGTVLDVGANAGWFSELAVHHGQRVTALDPDDVTIGILYERAREANLPILPLRMDIMWPTPAHGMGLAYASAPERLRSDASLWLAVVHHLARDGYPFEAIAAAVDAFTATAAAVEFVPGNDVHLKEWAVAKEPWYTQERFIAAMARYFPVVEVVPSSPDPRTLLLFRRA